MIGWPVSMVRAPQLFFRYHPILLYDPETLPRRQRDEPGEAAQRYALETVRLLSEVTREGYVFRVDLRLRPASKSALSPCRSKRPSRITKVRRWRGNALPISARACAGDIAGERSRSYPAQRLAAEPRFRCDRRIRRLTHRIRDEQRGPGSRTWLQSQARARQDPRGRVLCADAPADPWRARPHLRARGRGQRSTRWRQQRASGLAMRGVWARQAGCGRSNTACR